MTTEERYAALLDASRALIVKLDAVFAAINAGPIMVAHVHGVPYTGPITEPEYTAFKRLVESV